MPQPDSVTIAAVKNQLVEWRFTPAHLRGCALPAWRNLVLEGATPSEPVSRTVSGQTDSSQGVLAPGLYLGPWNDEYRTHWLALFVGPRRGPVAYDPPELLASCALSVRGDTVSFRTGQLTEASSGLGFNLVFTGRLAPIGITGVVQRVGRNMRPGGAVPLLLTHYAIDTVSSEADTGLSGLYDQLRGVPETGDVLGNELLLIGAEHGPVALWTEYAGGPDGPYRADSVTFRGNAVTIALNEYGLFTQRPLQRLTRTFTLESEGLTRRRSDPTRLQKRSSLRDFLRRAQSDSLPPPRCE
jgi:hypothetical protein